MAGRKLKRRTSVPRAILLAALLLAATISIPSGTADYTHLMSDPARSAIVDAGPELPNTLWRESIGGNRSIFQPPLIYNGEVFVASLRMGEVDGSPAAEALGSEDGDPLADIWRLDLQAGKPELWIEAVPALNLYDDSYVHSMAIGGGQLITSTGNGIAAYDIDGDDQREWYWDIDFSPVAGPEPIAICFATIATAEQVIASCLLLPTVGSDDEPRSRETGKAGILSYESVVASFDPRTCVDSCEPDYIWHRDAQGAAGRRDPANEEEILPRVDEANAAPSPVMSYAYGVTLSDGVLALAFVDYQLAYEAVDQWILGPSIEHAARIDHGEISLWVLDASDLSYLWDDRSSIWAATSNGQTGEDHVTVEADFGYAHFPRIQDGLLYHTIDRELRGVGIGTWIGDAFGIGASSDEIGFASNSITGRENDIWVSSMDKLYRINRDLDAAEIHAQAPAADPDAPDERWGALTPFLLADDTLFAVSMADENKRTAIPSGGDYVTVHALDAESLDTKWRLRVEDNAPPRLGTPAAEYAVSDGLVILHTRSGDIIALGGKGAGLDANGPARYPAADEEVILTIQQPADRYQVDWGDRSALQWTTNPTASHAYEREGTYHVVAVAESEGKWISKQWTVDVGGTPPNVLSDFVAENPDAAWGLFGFIIILIGAAFTSVKLARRRGIMKRELAAIEAAAETAAGSSTQLRAATDERRARAHGLLLDHKIDEAQYQILLRHIDEADRGNRMDQLRPLFDFLPFSMVRALEQLLADGQVSTVEHRGIQAMLKQNTVLTAAQKRKVGALVDDWFAQDAGGA